MAFHNLKWRSIKIFEAEFLGNFTLKQIFTWIIIIVSILTLNSIILTVPISNSWVIVIEHLCIKKTGLFKVAPIFTIISKQSKCFNSRNSWLLKQPINNTIYLPFWNHVYFYELFYRNYYYYSNTRNRIETNWALLESGLKYPWFIIVVQIFVSVFRFHEIFGFKYFNSPPFLIVKRFSCELFLLLKSVTRSRFSYKKK